MLGRGRQERKCDLPPAPTLRPNTTTRHSRHQSPHLQHGLDGLGVVQLLEHLAEEAVVAAIAITIAWEQAGVSRWGGGVSGLPGVPQARRAADGVGHS